MPPTNTETEPRRVTVILGTGSSRRLLDLVLPLLGRDQSVEMKGVFLEEAGVQHAAELPFVQELCRVTFGVREFNSEHFERALGLRMRTAQRALAVLARRAGVVHSFQNVRGSAARLLWETASSSDITIFEPVRRATVSLTATTVVRRPLQRISVLIDDFESGSRALAAAQQMADGHLHRLSILLTPAAAGDERVRELLLNSGRHDRPGQILPLSAEGTPALIGAIQSESPELLVIGATGAFLTPDMIRELRERLRCPVCLVRRWEAEQIQGPSGPEGSA